MHLIENDLSPETLAAEAGVDVAIAREAIARVGDVDLARAMLRVAREQTRDASRMVREQRAAVSLPPRRGYALGFSV